MSGPREFREKFYGRLPHLNEYREYLTMKLAETYDMDCGCDLDFAQGRLQEYVNSWPKVFNEEGGI